MRRTDDSIAASDWRADGRAGDAAAGADDVIVGQTTTAYSLATAPS